MSDTQSEVEQEAETEEDDFEGWLCTCGHWEDSFFHCTHCGRQPPWGCDCSQCDEPDYEDEDDFDTYGPDPY